MKFERKGKSGQISRQQFSSGIDELQELTEKEKLRMNAASNSVTWNKLCNILSGMPGSRQDNKAFCDALLDMAHEHRADAIQKQYGERALDMVQQLLDQLKSQETIATE